MVTLHYWKSNGVGKADIGQFYSINKNASRCHVYSTIKS